VLNGVINRAVQSNQTVVTGGATVPATSMAPMPALYAMSYSNAQGGLSVVITNKIIGRMSGFAGQLRLGR